MNLKPLQFVCSFVLLLCLGWTTVLANPITITVNKNTGKWTKTNQSGSWASQWTSTQTNPMLTLSCSANNMNYYNSGNEIEMFTGNNSVRYSANYTLAVTPGYEIVSYQFEYSSNKDNLDIVVTPNGATALSSKSTTQWTQVKAENINKPSAQFNVKHSAQTEQGFARVRNFTVTINKSKVPNGTHYLYVTNPGQKPYRIPAMACTKEGKLLAFSDYRPCGSDIGFGEVDIQLRTSTDNGKTWTAARTIANGTGQGNGIECGFGDAAVVADRESNEVLMLCVAGKTVYFQADYTKGNPNRMVRFVSTDGGETWGQYEDLTNQVYGLFDNSAHGAIKSMFVGSGKLHQSSKIKEGTHYRIYAPICARDNGNRVLYSDDFGKTWEVLGGEDALPIPAGDEPKCEELPDGRVLLSSRTNGGRYYNIYTYTDAQTGEGYWAQVAKSEAANKGVTAQSNSCNGEILILPVKRNSDNKQMFLALQSVPFGPQRSNVGIYYKALAHVTDYHTPAAFASNWTGKKQVSFMNSAYSTMILQKDNRIAFYYEESTYGADYTNVYLPLTLEEITNNQFTYDATVPYPTEDKTAILATDLEQVKTLLAHQGLGYPKAATATRKALQDIYLHPEKSNKVKLQTAIEAFLNDTSVDLPEDGKMYRIKFLAKDGKKYVMHYEGGKIVTKPQSEPLSGAIATMPEGGAIAGRAAQSQENTFGSDVFKAKVLQNGKIAFATADGKYLSYPTKSPGPSWLKNYNLTGVSNTFDEKQNALELQKAVVGSKVTVDDSNQLFGKFFIKSFRGNKTTDNSAVMGYWILKTENNVFDAAADAFFNNTFSSLIEVERVVAPLGKKVTSLSEINPNKAYALYNEHFTAYAVKKENQNNVWVQGMKGDASHTLSNAEFKQPFDKLSAMGAWQLKKNTKGEWMLYNIGAKQYVRTPDDVSACTFVNEPKVIHITALGDGGFAFNTGTHSQRFFCAAPQLSGSPIGVWTSADAGSKWFLYENPNISVPTTIKAIKVKNTKKAYRKGIYNLLGQRIKNNKLSQLPSGIYIVNGKKVAVDR